MDEFLIEKYIEISIGISITCIDVSLGLGL